MSCPISAKITTHFKIYLLQSTDSHEHIRQQNTTSKAIYTSKCDSEHIH